MRISSLFDFYVNSSMHVALSVVSLSLITCIEQAIPYDEVLLGFIFFATVVGYNFVKYFTIFLTPKTLNPTMKQTLFFSLFSFLALCVCVFSLRLETCLLLLSLGVVTVFYAVPFSLKFKSGQKRRNLRELPKGKIYIIAFVWAVLTVLVPVVNADIAVDRDMVLDVLQRFIFVVVLMFPFEIRDLCFDRAALKTVPQQIGVKNTKLLGCVLLCVFVFLDIFKDHSIRFFLYSKLLIAIITIAGLLGSYEKQTKWYSSFWIEALPIIWLFLVLGTGLF